MSLWGGFKLKKGEVVLILLLVAAALVAGYAFIVEHSDWKSNSVQYESDDEPDE